MFREWRQYVNLAIGALFPSFGATGKWHENNIALGPRDLAMSMEKWEYTLRDKCYI
jgi:hypothetical protein